MILGEVKTKLFANKGQSDKTKKDASCLFRRILLIAAPFMLIAVMTRVMVINDPMSCFEGEYACYRQNREVAQHSDRYYRVLICGDSTAKTSWVPALLSDDSYNYALGGGIANRRILLYI